MTEYGVMAFTIIFLSRLSFLIFCTFYVWPVVWNFRRRRERQVAMQEPLPTMTSSIVKLHLPPRDPSEYTERV